jgi:hypothetical protein
MIASGPPAIVPRLVTSGMNRIQACRPGARFWAIQSNRVAFQADVFSQRVLDNSEGPEPIGLSFAPLDPHWRNIREVNDSLGEKERRQQRERVLGE